MELAGVVIRNENHGRFVPDVDPNLRLRLTAAPMEKAGYPDAHLEINLYDLIGQRISFECQGKDGLWVWGVDRTSLEIDETIQAAQANPSIDAWGVRSHF